MPCLRLKVPFTALAAVRQADDFGAPPGFVGDLAPGQTEAVGDAQADADGGTVGQHPAGKAVEVAKQMGADAESLKDILIQTVASNHPNIPNEITDEQFRACRTFLSHFLGEANKGGKVYTLNYDLLLYWTLMHDESQFEGRINLERNDGFGRDEDTEPEYVNWMGESGARTQRVHYLHGALHLFDAGAELQKYTWVNTKERPEHHA